MVAHEATGGASEWDPSNDDDVVVVASAPDDARGPGHPSVMNALRYVLNRHELLTGTAPPQMIAVVSALGNEGVTTVSRSLAEVLSARTDSGVCWVDLGEIDRFGSGSVPSLGATSSASGAGRIDRNIGDRASSASVQAMPVIPPLPGGPSVGADTRAEFESVLLDLSGRYRHVILDTPPLLSQPDSLGFMHYADAYIMVARYGVTTRNHVRRIHEELHTVPPLGAVLNGYRTRTPRFIRRFFSD